MSQLSDLALQIAISQIGQEEKPKGSNWGHPVQDYLASVNIHFPASWCAAFLYWCFDHAAGQLGQPNPVFKTGGVLSNWNNSKAHQINLVVLSQPEPGDIFIMDLGNGLGHTGIVESVNKDGSMNTIEGNTNDTGGREGFEVARRVRQKKAPIIGFLRY